MGHEDHLVFVAYVALAICLVVAIGALALILVLCQTLIKQIKIQGEAAKQLDASRFDYEKRLAYLRVRLERAASFWKRKADFAEQALADFHEINQLLIGARERPHGATRSFSDYRAVKQDLDQHQELIRSLSLQRHRAFAFFGVEGSEPFEGVMDLVRDIRHASYLLAESEIVDKQLTPESRVILERKIWSNPTGSDLVAERMASLLEQTQRVFGSALKVPMPEGGFVDRS